MYIMLYGSEIRAMTSRDERLHAMEMCSWSYKKMYKIVSNMQTLERI
jgi:hypothetical protein